MKKPLQHSAKAILPPRGVFTNDLSPCEVDTYENGKNDGTQFGTHSDNKQVILDLFSGLTLHEMDAIINQLTAIAESRLESALKGV